MVREQERYCIGNLSWLTETSHRDLGDEGLFNLIFEYIGHLCGDKTRGNGVVSDTAGCRFKRKTFGHGDGTAFAGTVVGLSGIACLPNDGSDVDNRSKTFFTHHFQCFTTPDKGRFQVGIDHIHELLTLHTHRQTVFGDTCIVHKIGK